MCVVSLYHPKRRAFGGTLRTISKHANATLYVSFATISGVGALLVIRGSAIYKTSIVVLFSCRISVKQSERFVLTDCLNWIFQLAVVSVDVSRLAQVVHPGIESSAPPVMHESSRIRSFPVAIARSRCGARAVRLPNSSLAWSSVTWPTQAPPEFGRSRARDISNLCARWRGLFGLIRNATLLICVKGVQLSIADSCSFRLGFHVGRNVDMWPEMPRCALCFEPSPLSANPLGGALFRRPPLRRRMNRD